MVRAGEGAVVTNAFAITGPAVLNVSGGRTSALMLRRVLDAHGGTLPRDVHAVTCNTGDEREETLAFLSEIERRWCALVWLERDATSPGKVREVSYETASRNAEPFAELIAARKFLPHHGARFCTQALKIEPVRAWMRAQGHEHWTSAVGLRADEPSRVAKHRERQAEEDDFDSVYPLHRAGIRKADVMDFWRGQSFDLALRPWESNCRGCFLKSRAILERTERDAPGSLAWWAAQEQRVGATFVKGRRYLDVIADAARAPLPGMFDEVETPIACNCTDRRRVRCRCGARRGQGHALACPVVMERWAA